MKLENLVKSFGAAAGALTLAACATTGGAPQLNTNTCMATTASSAQAPGILGGGGTQRATVTFDSDCAALQGVNTMLSVAQSQNRPLSVEEQLIAISVYEQISPTFRQSVDAMLEARNLPSITEMRIAVGENVSCASTALENGNREFTCAPSSAPPPIVIRR